MDVTPQQYTTIIVLLVGVFGGLGSVILLILFCKHCVKQQPDTGLDIEMEGSYLDKDPGAMAALIESSTAASPSVGSRDHSAHTPVEKRLLPRQNDRIDLVDLHTGLSIDSMDDKSYKVDVNDCILPSGWKGVITVDTADVCERLYTVGERSTRHETASQWSSADRDSISLQNSLRSRPSSHLKLSTAANTLQSHHGSRRTLQSSLDSSVCTDNRSEITVIEVIASDQRISLESGARSASQEVEESPQPNRNYLSAFRPVRRQSTQAELGRPTRERFERLIKSHDDATTYNRLQKQSVIQDDEDSFPGCYSRRNADRLSNLNMKLSKDGTKQKDSISHSGSSHSLRHDRADRLGDRPDRRGTVLDHQDSILSSNSLEPSNSSTRTSDLSYRQLWQLRSTLEHDSSADEMSVDDSLAHTITEDQQPRSHHEIDAVSANIVCNVVYTSFESENSANFTTDNDSHIAPDDIVPGDNFLHPPEQTYLGRRQCFQRLLNSRGKTYLDANSSTEKSFDSFDTSTTDGPRSSESSRVEFTTTSFESSTTNESDSHSRRHPRLAPKDDSGYKSTEANVGSPDQGSPTSVHSAVPQTSISFAIDCVDNKAPDKISPSIQSVRKQDRTASRRRRDFQSRGAGPNNHNIITSCSSIELDTTDSNHLSGDSFDENGASSKYNVFYKFFHSNSRFGRHRQPKRDYSVDEKTDALFKEFTRYDPSYENASQMQSPGRPRYSRSSSSPLINTAELRNQYNHVGSEQGVLRARPQRANTLIPHLGIHRNQSMEQMTNC